MRFSTPFQAKDLKAELKAAGIKVGMCRQHGNHALIAIANTAENQEAFEKFARGNDYAGTCDMELKKFNVINREYPYLDYGNVFKYRRAING